MAFYKYVVAENMYSRCNVTENGTNRRPPLPNWGYPYMYGMPLYTGLGRGRVMRRFEQERWDARMAARDALAMKVAEQIINDLWDTTVRPHEVSEVYQPSAASANFFGALRLSMQEEALTT
jgi:hypothetical protein